MKQGMTLQDCATEIERQAKAKRDFIADSRELFFLPESDGVLRVNGHGQYGVDRNAHTQIATRLGIPQRYYDRMLSEAPALFAANANHWNTAKPARRMVRTLDGNVRADLSDRYRRLDNHDFAQVALNTLGEIDSQMVVASCNITPHQLDIKAFFPSVQGEVRVGEVVRAGIWLSNNEVGGGRLKALPMTEVLRCTNGAVYQQFGVKQTHSGGRIDGDGEEAFELFADDTLKSDDKTLWLKVRDMIRACGKDEIFQKLLSRLREATQDAIENPVKAVEVLAEQLTFTEDEKSGVLRHLISGGDISRWGLSNAVNRMSQDVETYQRATELEVGAGRLIELQRDEWLKISDPSLN
jgi:hypothetical protein